MTTGSLFDNVIQNHYICKGAGMRTIRYPTHTIVNFFVSLITLHVDHSLRLRGFDEWIIRLLDHFSGLIRILSRTVLEENKGH